MIESWTFALLIPILALMIPIVAITTSHFQKMARIKRDMLEDQLKLEQLKNDNFLLETEKMRLELSKMQLGNQNEKHEIL